MAGRCYVVDRPACAVVLYCLLYDALTDRDRCLYLSSSGVGLSESLLGDLTAGPDLLPGMPGTLLSSCDFVMPLFVPDLVSPDDVVAGPDLLPGSPVTPGLDVPPVPGAFCVWF